MALKHTKSLRRNLVIALCAVACIVIFIIIFANSDNLPGWDSLFNSMGLSPKTGADEDFVRVLDVGQGDGIYISSNGKTAMIDTGPPESNDSLLKDLAQAHTARLDVVLITHLHMDHVGGLESVLSRYKIMNLILPNLFGEEEGLPAAKVASARITEAEGGVYTARQGMFMNIGDFTVTVLCQYEDLSKENDRSIVVMAEMEGVKFLLTGDAESACENRLLRSGIDFSCTVLKVGHHGSGTSSTAAFIEAAAPKYAAISVGKNNQYSHPGKETLETLQKYGAEIFRTDRDGNITFYVEDGQLRIELENFK